MQLSTHLFDRIVGISTAKEAEHKPTVLPAGCRKAPERRAAARIAFGQRTLICRDGGSKAGVWDTVMLQDISQRGIGFLCEKPMQNNETFMLKLTDKEGDTIRIRCSIKRCERGGFGGTAYLLGADFEQVIVHQPIRVTDEEGEEATTETDAASAASPAGVVQSKPEETKARPSIMARAAASLLRAVDPSQWRMRKADDFSSVG